jgi:hypothetical protein
MDYDTEIEKTHHPENFEGADIGYCPDCGEELNGAGYCHDCHNYPYQDREEE